MENEYAPDLSRLQYFSFPSFYCFKYSHCRLWKVDPAVVLRRYIYFLHPRLPPPPPSLHSPSLRIQSHHKPAPFSLITLFLPFLSFIPPTIYPLSLIPFLFLLHASIPPAFVRPGWHRRTQLNVNCTPFPPSSARECALALHP